MVRTALPSSSLSSSLSLPTWYLTAGDSLKLVAPDPDAANRKLNVLCDSSEQKLCRPACPWTTVESVQSGTADTTAWFTERDTIAQASLDGTQVDMPAPKPVAGPRRTAARSTRPGKCAVPISSAAWMMTAAPKLGNTKFEADASGADVSW